MKAVGRELVEKSRDLRNYDGWSLEPVRESM